MRPLNLTVPVGRTITKNLHVKVINADIAGNPENIRLTAASDCPSGVIIGTPQFPPKVSPSDTIWLRAGIKGTAIVPVTIHPMDFANANHKAPSRCTLTFTAATQVAGNTDPAAANNTMTIEMNVVDKNAPEIATAHESVIQSMAPLKMTIPRGKLTFSKTVRPTVTNADIIPAPEASSDAIHVSVDLSGCPGITVTTLDMDRNITGGQNTVAVGGGKSASGLLQLSFDSSAFTTRSKLSPSRCTAMLIAAVPNNTEPDPTNNMTRLIIDVIDGNDL